MRDMKLSPTSLKWFLSTVGVTILTVGMNAGAIVMVSPTEIEGIDCEEMIAAYKQAYTNAGFTFEKKTMKIEKQTMQKYIRHIYTTLVFRFSISRSRGKPSGVASFVFVSSVPKDPNRVVCPAYRDIFSGGDYSYAAKEWDANYTEMVSADKRATAQVRKKLGNSLPAMK